MKRRDFLRCGAAAAGAFISLDKFPHQLVRIGSEEARDRPRHARENGHQGVPARAGHRDQRCQPQLEPDPADGRPRPRRPAGQGRRQRAALLGPRRPVRQPSACEDGASDGEARQRRHSLEDAREHREGDVGRSRSVPQGDGHRPHRHRPAALHARRQLGAGEGRRDDGPLRSEAEGDHQGARRLVPRPGRDEGGGRQRLGGRRSRAAESCRCRHGRGPRDDHRAAADDEDSAARASSA